MVTGKLHHLPGQHHDVKKLFFSEAANENKKINENKNIKKVLSLAGDDIEDKFEVITNKRTTST